MNNKKVRSYRINKVAFLDSVAEYQRIENEKGISGLINPRACNHNWVRKSCYTLQCTKCKVTKSDTQHKMGSYSYIGNCKERATCSACGSYSTRTSHRGYSGATCTSPARCDCGSTTSGSSLGHNWVSNHHEAEGSGHPHPMHDKCSRCGACRSSGSNASWSETTSCVSDGCWDNVRCSRCGTLIRTKEHHHSGGASATCTTPAKCKCGKTNIGSALGHNYSNGVCTRCGQEDPNACKHPNATWTNWVEYGGGCKRDKICNSSICKGKIVATETFKEHAFKGNGQLEPYSETRHMEKGACSRCLTPLGYLKPHSYVNGICACGAMQGGGGGGGNVNPPVINSFTAKSNKGGMTVQCSVSATNAVRYVYGLYENAGSNNLITSSGTTSNTSWTFSTTPNTSYFIVVDAFNAIGKKTRKGVTLTTDNALPADFNWKVKPQMNGDFSISITSKEWERLQMTVNAWRKYYNQPLYTFVQIQANETSFTVANRGDDFTHIFFNQIINGISTIPQFKGTLPPKKSSKPRRWLASEFNLFATALNSLRK